ncbi:MAG: polysaccharide biosynthesis tyrosine autokinase [Nitrospirota bacterium]
MSNKEDKSSSNANIQKIDEFPVSSSVSPTPEETEKEIDLRDYLHILLRRKWTLITFLIVVVTTVLIGTFLATPIYRSTATIKIDRENLQVLKFEDIYKIERTEDDYYQTQYKILKSRNLAKRVIRSMKLGENPEFAGNDKLSHKVASVPLDNVSRQNMHEDINKRFVDSFLGNVTITPEQRSRLVKVSFDSHDPELSAKVANEIAKSYIQFSIESRFEATQQASDWLKEQLDDMKAKVERSEESLNKYAADNRIIFLTEGETTEAKTIQGQNIITRKLAELSTVLVQATSDRISKEALYREAQRGEGGLLSVVQGNPLIQTLKKEYASKEVEYYQLSKKFKPEYPKMVRLKEEMDKIEARINIETRKMVSSIKKDYETAQRRENSLRSTLENYQKEALDLNDRMVQYQILRREADTNRELYNGLLQRLKETGISASLTTSNIQVLDWAEVQQSPCKPRKKRNLLLAIITGLFGGIGLAFFVEYLDNTIKTPEDLEKTVSLPSLGVIPNLGKQGDRSRISLITFEDKKSPLSEAFRSIGTYIQFSSPVRPPKTMLVTSARKAEGKTSTVVNLGITLAYSLGKGIVVDADMRNPQLHKIFSLDNSNGLSSFLTGHLEFDNGLIQKTDIPNLDVITSGIIPPNPSELLSSQKMKDLLFELIPLYSFIIFDSPPLLGLSDSLILSTVTDGAILVVRSDNTPKEAALQARKSLQGVNAKILGVVLNDIKQSNLKYGSYSYYYSYYYDGEEEYDDKGKKKRRRKGDRA